MQKAELQPYMPWMWKYLRETDPSSQAAQLVTVGVVERWGFTDQCFPLCTQAGILSLGTRGFLLDDVAWNWQKKIRQWCFLFWKAMKKILWMKTLVTTLCILTHPLRWSWYSVDLAAGVLPKTAQIISSERSIWNPGVPNIRSVPSLSKQFSSICLESCVCKTGFLK